MLLLLSFKRQLSETGVFTTGACNVTVTALIMVIIMTIMMPRQQACVVAMMRKIDASSSIPFYCNHCSGNAQWCTSLQAIMWDQSFVWLKFDWLEPSNLSAALHCTIG